MTLIHLIAMWAITFAIKETDGPFNLVSHGRQWLLNNKLIQVHFFNLLQCYFCLGTYSGLIVYLLATPISQMNLFNCIEWMFVGAGASYLIDLVVERIRK